MNARYYERIYYKVITLSSILYHLYLAGEEIHLIHFRNPIKCNITLS